MIKLLEENMERTLYDASHSKILYDLHPRVMEIKINVNKQDLINLKSFFTAKETISKMKRQPSEWERITLNEATAKRLIFKVYKQLMKLNIRKTKNPIKRWAEHLFMHLLAFYMSSVEKYHQNHNEVSSHTGQNGHHQKVQKQ